MNASTPSATGSLLTWNAAWAGPRSRAWAWASRTFAEIQVAALTECRLDAIARWDGHTLAGGIDWGYANQPAAYRKVALWSRHPWQMPDDASNLGLPPGRFIAGTTTWEGSDVRIVCVCVPWRSAHVSTGRRDRTIWGDHATFLQHLPSALEAQREHRLPLILAGDFNQPFPDAGNRIPTTISTALEKVLRALEVPSAGLVGRKPLIDHIAHEAILGASGAQVIEASHDGRPMSDHDAVILHLSRRAAHPDGSEA